MKTKNIFSGILLMGAFCINAFATIHTVTVNSNFFFPSSFSASVGDTVRWVWVSGSHTTTSTTIPGCATIWNAPMTSSNDTFEYVIPCDSTYNYKCTPHGFTGTFTATVAGIEENDPFSDLKMLVKFFPNPVTVSGKVTFECSQPTNMSLAIYDLNGRMLQEHSMRSENGENKFEFDTASLPAGTYIYSLASDDKKIVSGKFSVAK